MWPWTHVAVGYLLYSAYLHLRWRLRPAGAPTLAVASGALVPDLIDKSFAWYLPVLPSGRSLGHSLLVGVILVALVYWFARRTDRTSLGRSFAIGYLSHPLADGLLPLVRGEWEFLTFLAWPVLPSPQYQGPHSVLARVAGIDPTPYFLFQLALTALGATVWARHGYPGLETVRQRVAGGSAEL